MPFLMSVALELEIMTLAWIDNASVQFPLNIYATKGFTHRAYGQMFRSEHPRGSACAARPISSNPLPRRTAKSSV